MKVTTDTLEFVISYIDKHIDKSIRVPLGDTVEQQLAFFADYQLDDAAYKRMMTSYRVTKKRALDKESGNDLVTITVTKKSHELLKQLSALHHVTLAQAAEFFDSSIDLQRENKILSQENNDLKQSLVYQETRHTVEKSNLDSQTWCFSQEDLQEQAKLVEKLITENSRLQAELQLAKRQLTQPIQPTQPTSKSGLEVWNLKTKVAELSKELDSLKSQAHSSTELIHTLMEENDTYKEKINGLEFQLSLSPAAQCQALTASGEQCKRTNDLIACDGVLLCNNHKRMYEKGTVTLLQK